MEDTMIRYIYKLTTCFISAIFFASCVAATVPMATPEKDLEAKQFTCPADKARIYVYLLYAFTEGEIPYEIKIGGKIWGALANNTYLVLDVVPGEHIISFGVRSIMSINAEAGKLYFIETKALAWTWSIEQVSEEEGKKNIENSKLAMGLLK
jgi:hypothetical protein